MHWRLYGKALIDKFGDSGSQTQNMKWRNRFAEEKKIVNGQIWETGYEAS